MSDTLSQTRLHETYCSSSAALLRCEGSGTQSQAMASGSDDQIRAAAARSIAHKQRNHQVNGKLRSMSFSDSAHSSQQHQLHPANKLRSGLSLNMPRQSIAQYTEHLDTSPHNVNGTFRGQDSAYAPADMYHATQDASGGSHPLPSPQHESGMSPQTAPALQPVQLSSSGRMEPVAEVNEEASVHSSYGAEASGPALDSAPAAEQAPATEKAPAPEQASLHEGDRTKVIRTPWANGNAEWPHKQTIPFVSVDDSLKRHWRMIALQVCLIVACCMHQCGECLLTH